MFLFAEPFCRCGQVVKAVALHADGHRFEPGHWYFFCEPVAREDHEREGPFEPSQHHGVELRADCGSAGRTTVEQTERLRVIPAIDSVTRALLRPLHVF